MQLWRFTCFENGNERRLGSDGNVNPRRRVCMGLAYAAETDSYLVDPASSHMLVSKIKPCMSKYKHICTVKLRMAH